MKLPIHALLLAFALGLQPAFAAELKEEESLKGAPLGALLVDLAGSALQRQSAVALSLETGESGPRARLDLPLVNGFFHDKRRLDLRLSGPIDLDPEGLKSGETDIFGDAIALEAAFTYIRWNPGSATSESMRTELCSRFQAQFLTGNNDYISAGSPVFSCTERSFTSFAKYVSVPSDAADSAEFRKNLGIAWRTAYLAWTQAADTCSRTPVVVPVDERYAGYLPPAPPMPEDCVKAKTDNLLIFRMGLAGGYRDVDRLSADETAITGEKEYPYAANLSLGWYISDNFSLTLGADYQSFFENGDEKTLCSGDAATTPLACRTGLDGGAREESPGVALDVGHRLGSLPLAYRIVAKYRSKDELATVRIPVFLSTDFDDKADQMGGGVEVSWDNNSNEPRFSVFIGRAFKLGP